MTRRKRGEDQPRGLYFPLVNDDRGRRERQLRRRRLFSLILLSFNLAVLGAFGVLALSRSLARRQFQEGVPFGVPTSITPRSGVGAFPLTAVEDALQRLPPGRLEYEVPAKMKLEAVGHVTLVISSDPRQDLQAAIRRASGSASVRVSATMAAHLTSPYFRIQELDSEVQLIGGSPTIWGWDIVPIRVGSIPIHLRVSVIIDIKGKGQAKDVTVFDRRITVAVSRFEQVKNFFTGNWQWLMAFVLGPTSLVGIVKWLRTRGQRRKEAMLPSRTAPSRADKDANGSEAGLKLALGIVAAAGVLVAGLVKLLGWPTWAALIPLVLAGLVDAGLALNDYRSTRRTARRAAEAAQEARERLLRRHLKHWG
jgi:hypothetical protein